MGRFQEAIRERGVKVRILDSVLSFFQQNPEFGYTPSSVASELSLNRNTVRRVLQELFQSGALDKFERGYYALAAEVWFRHYVATIEYCSGEKFYSYAVTFTNSPTSAEHELLNAIIEATIDSCGNHEETGYSVMPTNDGRTGNNTFPNIETGEL